MIDRARGQQVEQEHSTIDIKFRRTSGYQASWFIDTQQNILIRNLNHNI